MPIVAAVMPAPYEPIELREFPEPDIEPGGMLLKTMYSEVCGTDVHLWHGRLAGVPYPIIPGHVSVGTVAKARGPITLADGQQAKEGDRLVFFDVHRTCGRCHACAVTGTPTKCVHRKVYGITDAAADGLFGGWSEAIYLEPGVVAAVLPDKVRAEDYIGGGCGLITAVHAIDRAAIRLADRVLVQGTGAVGLSVVALARLSGASTIIATGAPADRLDLARRMGADLTLDITRTTPDERRDLVMGVTGGRGPDIIIEASGSPKAVEEALTLVRDGGRYVIAGHYTNAGDSTINAHEHINRKHVEIRGCWGSEAGHFIRSIAILEQHAHHVPWRAIGAKVYPLNRLNEALADAEAMRLPKALVNPRLRA
ncbi:MAG: zinc-binding dehydrogenase [Acidobacteria bacterium]|nr:zinc-binding dehydrogenase [Acidobacteriota bacterium]